MIAVRLSGGIGNQLFQYATGRQLSVTSKADLILDLSGFSARRKGETPRDYELNHFNIAARFATPIERQSLWLCNSLPIIGPLLSGWNTFRERDFGYNTAIKSQTPRTYLIGYWQSYKYFEDISVQLADELCFKQPLSDRNRRISDEMKTHEAVAVHVRRGDYVTLKSASSFHGILSQEYYFRATSRMREVVSEPKFYVFSDDPSWCQQNLFVGDFSVTYVSQNGGKDAWQDLALMAACSHHIIANSSFSWWGAWFADCRRKNDRSHIVVAPRAWFKLATVSISDRFPPHWQVI